MKHAKNRWLFVVLGAYALFLLSSCAHSRNIAYFRDLSDTARVKVLDSIKNFEPSIQPGDILDIYVTSMNTQASSIFNLGNVVPSPASAQGLTNGQAQAVGGDVGGAGAVRGYKVDGDGTIDFPVLGKMSVSGYTTSQLRDSIKVRLGDYLKVPVVNVRFLNYKITILGEVARPASYIISGERATIIDALGMAGDLTVYGKREDVLVIREENGKRIFARLDLTSSRVFNSPYYFLKQNDIVYVEPIRAKAIASDDRLVRLLSISGAFLGIVVSVVLLFKL